MIKAGLCFKIYSNDELTKKDKDAKRPLSFLTETKNEKSVMVSLEHKPNEFLSLFNISVQYLVCDGKKLSKFKSIEVLRLGRWQIFSNHHIEVTDTFLVFKGSLE